MARPGNTPAASTWRAGKERPRTADGVLGLMDAQSESSSKEKTAVALQAVTYKSRQAVAATWDHAVLTLLWTSPALLVMAILVLLLRGLLMA